MIDRDDLHSGGGMTRTVTKLMGVHSCIQRRLGGEKGQIGLKLVLFDLQLMYLSYIHTDYTSVAYK